MSVLFAAVDREDTATIDALVQHGHVDRQDGLGNSLMHWAVIKHAPTVVARLLQAHPDLTLRNKENCTVLDLAQAYGFGDLVDMIEGGGREGKGSSTDNGRPPLWPRKAEQEEETGEGDGYGRGYEEEEGFYEAPVEGPSDESYFYDF